ncbi:centaurin-gamma-1A isoform X3 [Parasteatoda tepidariorum]|uniref:centaurin-gamma-1A isoform X3 n=1 Tax=Parasteatoda tepidariorum TaxID=114398 RepID=UPI00077FC136|nr:centaurin-gamma-1A isoform X3 [Parasteatoda tepidariorum]
MNNRGHVPQPYYSNSLAIRQEIQRFESVHPSIYAIYDHLELMPDPLLAQQIREHVVCIEDSFVNSQEWTLSRSVPDLRLGIVGSLSSGKSALVHRYLTGSYMQDESPEGGRFKKEVVIEGQSYLLLIRDEGGPPEIQFSCWVDAVIYVFSLENEASFNAIYNYYTKMSYYRSPGEVPLILVGTQDAISESNPRVIDDSRARKLANDLKRCSYYETCATYGLNVERVFQDACQKIVQQKMAGITSRPSTPNHPVRCNSYVSNSSGVSSANNGYHPSPNVGNPTLNAVSASPSHLSHSAATHNSKDRIDGSVSGREMKDKSDRLGIEVLVPNTVCGSKDVKDLPTPCSTPTTSRKTRRRSNLFPVSNPLKKGEDDKKSKNGEVGSGRVIPLRQGYLYKRSSKALNKEWKKKYVTLTSDGRLTYHPSLHDYMDDIHGKEIPLMHTTVKIPGQKPRGSRTQGTSTSASSHQVNELASELSSMSIAGGVLTGSETQLIPAVPSTNPLLSRLDTPIVKKRHRRMKSTGLRNMETMDDSDDHEFIIVSLDNKQWHFEASSSDDREAWITAIEQQILTSLQGNESCKTKSGRTTSSVDQTLIQSIKNSIPGNSHCVDCDAPNPDWASLNIGALMCIECSGIHRNLGSHISRVRSLDLDEWLPEHVSVMMALGNISANNIWEGNTKGRAKPTPNSSREEKERWIRAKYEFKEFLAPVSTTTPLGQQLIDSVCKSDIKGVALVLAHSSSPEHVNTVVGPRDQRTAIHLAAALGNLPITQLLIWNNANVKTVDSDGKTAATYAKNGGYQEVHDLLIHSGCPDLNPPTTSTLPRRRGSLSKKSTEVFDKLPASII